MLANCRRNKPNGWDEDELFALVKRAYPYRNLSRASHSIRVIDMLSEGIAAQRGRYGAYLHHDRINRKLRARRGARLAAITSGGAIPDNALFTVVAEPDGAAVGTVDEDFAVESMAGDIMLLGNTSWRIRRVEGRSSRVLVEDAHGSPPTVPFWRGEAPARTTELSKPTRRFAAGHQRSAEGRRACRRLAPFAGCRRNGELGSRTNADSINRARSS